MNDFFFFRLFSSRLSLSLGHTPSSSAPWPKHDRLSDRLRAFPPGSFERGVASAHRRNTASGRSLSLWL